MSGRLYEFAKRFAAGEITAEAFVDTFMEIWKQERDSAAGMDIRDSDELNETLSTIFCLADLYNAAQDREEYELDESRLRLEVRKSLGT